MSLEQIAEGIYTDHLTRSMPFDSSRLKPGDYSLPGRGRKTVSSEVAAYFVEQARLYDQWVAISFEHIINTAREGMDPRRKPTVFGRFLQRRVGERLNRLYDEHRFFLRPKARQRAEYARERFRFLTDFFNVYNTGGGINEIQGDFEHMRKNGYFVCIEHDEQLVYAPTPKFVKAVELEEKGPAEDEK